MQCSLATRTGELPIGAGRQRRCLCGSHAIISWLGCRRALPCGVQLGRGHAGLQWVVLAPTLAFEVYSPLERTTPT